MEICTVSIVVCDKKPGPPLVIPVVTPRKCTDPIFGYLHYTMYHGRGRSISSSDE